jgi:hypothetical protein
VALAERSVLVLDAATDTPLVNAGVTWSTALDGKPLDASAATDARGRLRLALPIGAVAFRRGGGDSRTVVSCGADAEVVVRLAA